MKLSQPRVLVTNDDGIAAPGLRWLARAAVEHGLDVVVAAPRHEASGMSAALRAVIDEGRVLVEPADLPGLDGVPAYGVAATPAYIVLLAGLGGFGPAPDLVLSGINRGANAGHAILHSGTVGAAATAADRGARALAVSLDIMTVPPSGSDEEARHWSSAGAMVRRLLPGLLDAPQGTVLNLNVPDRPLAAIAGLRPATLAPFGQVQMTIAETGQGYLRIALELDPASPLPGSDVTLLAEGYATVTPIRVVGPGPDFDLGDNP